MVAGPAVRLPDMDGLDTEQRRLVEAARVARLGTTRRDGTPHVVPITFACDGRSIVTAVDAKPKTTASLQRLRNITAHPAVSVLIDHYDEDWNRLWWARADGSARIKDAETVPNALDLLTAKYPQYREQRPDGPVIVIRIERWATWSAKTSRLR